MVKEVAFRLTKSHAKIKNNHAHFKRVFLLLKMKLKCTTLYHSFFISCTFHNCIVQQTTKVRNQ